MSTLTPLHATCPYMPARATPTRRAFRLQAERRRNERQVAVKVYENSVLGLGTTTYHVEIQLEDGTAIHATGHDRSRTIWQAFDKMYGGSGSYR